MPRVHFDFSAALSPEAMAARNTRMADALLRRVRERILSGGDGEVVFAPLKRPRRDGSTDHPLLGGGALLDSLRPETGPGWFGLATDFPGAAALDRGSKPRGRGPEFALPGPGGRVLFASPPGTPARPFFRLASGDKGDLAREFAGE